jgi:hypothetical protein
LLAFTIVRVSLFIFLLGFLANCTTLKHKTQAAQSVEGTIQYHVAMGQENVSQSTAESRKRSFLHDFNFKNFPDTVSVTYQNSGYLVRSRRTPETWSLFRSAENRIYYFNQTNDMILCTFQDAGEDLEFSLFGSSPSIVHTDSTYLIGQFHCKRVDVHWKSGVYSYYYQPGYLPMHPGNYVNHHFDAWAAYLNIAGALPVRIVKSISPEKMLIYDFIGFNPDEVSSQLFEKPVLELLDQLQPPGITGKKIFRVRETKQ